MSKVGLSVRLVAKAGKENTVKEFITGALPLAVAEAGTIDWFAFQINENTFGIFDTFNDDAGRQAHLQGEIANALMANASELLAEDPIIEFTTILAKK